MEAWARVNVLLHESCHHCRETLVIWQLQKAAVACGLTLSLGCSQYEYVWNVNDFSGHHWPLRALYITNMQLLSLMLIFKTVPRAGEKLAIAPIRTLKL